MEWFRWYGGTFGDPKLQWVARQSCQNVAAVLAVWVAVLERAHNHDQRGCCDGLDLESMDVALGLDDGACFDIYQAMVRKGMIVDGDMVAAWDKRQPKCEDTTASDRKRNQRDRERLQKENDELRTLLTEQQSRNVTQCHDMSRNVTTEEKRREEKREDKTLKPTSSSPAVEDIPTEVVFAEEKAVTMTERFAIFEFRLAYQQATGEFLPGGLNNRALELCHRHPRDKLQAAFDQMASHGGKTFAYLVEVLKGKPKAEKTGFGKKTKGEQLQDGVVAAAQETLRLLREGHDAERKAFDSTG